MNWTTKTGEEIPINQMTTAHIENCIKLMERSGNTQSLYCAFDENDNPWGCPDTNYLYAALVEEMEARLKMGDGYCGEIPFPPIQGNLRQPGLTEHNARVAAHIRAALGKKDE